MKIIVCLDDNGGMAFNRRRQSRDRVLIEDIAKTVGNARLYIDKYSAPLFESAALKPTVSENMPSDAACGDYCFVETMKISELFVAEDIEEFVIYRWNRVYPRDLCFDFDLQKNAFLLVSSCDFAGYSHEKITKEIYRK